MSRDLTQLLPCPQQQQQHPIAHSANPLTISIAMVDSTSSLTLNNLPLNPKTSFKPNQEPHRQPSAHRLLTPRRTCIERKTLTRITSDLQQYTHPL